MLLVSMQLLVAEMRVTPPSVTAAAAMVIVCSSMARNVLPISLLFCRSLIPIFMTPPIYAKDDPDVIEDSLVSVLLFDEVYAILTSIETDLNLDPVLN